MLCYGLILLPTLVHAGFDLSWTWSDEISKWADKFAKARRGHSSDIRCHTCSTVNSSEITDSSGIHPGVFLTSLMLSSIPVTESCANPASVDEAPICDKGLCVKINYTARHSAYAQLRNIRCYSCTTMDAEQLLTDVQDPNWRRWLENVRFVPNTDKCNDNFIPEIALRDGVRSQECDNGVCMKMWFKEKNGDSQVWRSCIPNAQEQIRSDCTRITSSQGDMEVCTCDTNLCNASTSIILNMVLLLAFLLFAFSNI